MNTIIRLFTIAFISLSFYSCVSTKALEHEQAKYEQLHGSYMQSQRDFEKCRSERDYLAVRKSQLEDYTRDLNRQIGYLKENNTNLFHLTNKQAEILKRSIENMGSTNTFIQELQRSLARKDSLSMTLVMNLKGALGNINDEDINIQIDKSAIYISISDKLLFKSGSYEVSDNAQYVLGKVAQVLNSKPDIEFLVEGHTDTVAINKNCIVDNWDLSAKRATTIVRILQIQYAIEPKRMTAAGRSSYLPVQSNETAAGRAANRRTRIVILPQLNQFMELLENKHL
ncbi:MAG TPA: OmpA family protein [Segetibacter sp.]|nr:OmpA family protein [Segetibacter sp.]